MGHGVVFSMAVGTIGEWLKLVPFFFIRGRTVDSEGGGWQFLKIKTMAVKQLNKYSGLGP